VAIGECLEESILSAVLIIPRSSGAFGLAR
jgi:hypothetical protein